MSMLHRRRLLSGPSFDVDALAHRSVVLAAGGSYSKARLGLTSAFNRALKGGGVWPRLDRFWIDAAESDPGNPGASKQSLIDLVARSASTLVNSPTFTANRGWLRAATKKINVGFDPSTAGG